MSLDGLRAWIGEVERKLGARTRVFLVLTAIAVGGAGAAIYLSLEAQSNEVSEGDLQALETQVQEQANQLSATGGVTAETDPKLSELEAQIKVLQAKVDALEGGSKSDSSGESGDSAEKSPELGLKEAPPAEKDGGTSTSP